MIYARRWFAVVAMGAISISAAAPESEFAELVRDLLKHLKEHAEVHTAKDAIGRLSKNEPSAKPQGGAGMSPEAWRWIGAASNFLPLQGGLMGGLIPAFVDTRQQSVVAIQLRPRDGVSNDGDWSNPVTPDGPYDFLAVFAMDGSARIRWLFADGTEQEAQVAKSSLQRSLDTAPRPTAVSFRIDQESAGGRYLVLFRAPPRTY
jgi:hypothetical protein